MLVFDSHITNILYRQTNRTNSFEITTEHVCGKLLHSPGILFTDDG